MKSRKERFNQLLKKGMSNLTEEELKEGDSLNKYFYNGSKNKTRRKKWIK